MLRLAGPHQKPEKRRLVHSLFVPVTLVVLMFLIHLLSWLEDWDLFFMGVKPLSWEGLPGILTSPFIHGSWQHLGNNISSLFVLGVALFYFYREIAYRVFAVIYFLAGIWLWFGGRDVWHIGASGLVYGLAAFLFVSGVLRRHIPLMALALIVVFWYGSLVWGMFPLAPRLPHSWEGHLWGFVAGLAAAIVFRKEGPQKPPSPFSEEVEDREQDEEEEGEAYWKLPADDKKNEV